MLELRDLLLQENKHFIIIIWTQSVSYSVRCLLERKLPQQFGVRQWDSLDVTSGPDSGQRLITLELKVPTLPRKKDSETRDRSAVGTGGIDHWNQKEPRWHKTTSLVRVN